MDKEEKLLINPGPTYFLSEEHRAIINELFPNGTYQQYLRENNATNKGEAIMLLRQLAEREIISRSNCCITI